MSKTSSIRREGGKRTRNCTHDRQHARPLVSIITAVYNGSPTIENTIKSVLSQDYPDFEYIIIDGGSTDRTLEILNSYDEQIDYWVSEPDHGVYDAFNKAIDLAEGEWLYFLGADDTLIDGNILSRVFSRRHESMMLYGNVVWGDTGKLYGGRFYACYFLLRNICQQAIFYHKALFTILGKFDLRYSSYADWVFNMKAFGLQSAKPVFVDSIVAKYSIEGISSEINDIAFLKEKDALFTKIFIGKNEPLFLPLTKLIKLCLIPCRSLQLLVNEGPVVHFRKIARGLMRCRRGMPL